MARPKVVVVGGGPAGINACKALSKTADVTLIEAKEFHEIQWGAALCRCPAGITAHCPALHSVCQCRSFACNPKYD